MVLLFILYDLSVINFRDDQLAISLSEEWGCRFMECSAKENKNVREAFIQLGNAAFEKKKKIVAEKKANSGDKKKKSVCILL